jgi:hypothetical protein
VPPSHPSRRGADLARSHRPLLEKGVRSRARPGFSSLWTPDGATVTRVAHGVWPGASWPVVTEPPFGSLRGTRLDRRRACATTRRLSGGLRPARMALPASKPRLVAPPAPTRSSGRCHGHGPGPLSVTSDLARVDEAWALERGAGTQSESGRRPRGDRERRRGPLRARRRVHGLPSAAFPAMAELSPPRTSTRATGP